MRHVRLLALPVMASTYASGATAADWKALRGTYAVTAKNYLDPSDGEPKDSHRRIQLSGDAARDLYNAMKTSASADACTGALAKRIGEMQCLHYRKEKRYACSFSVDVLTQKIDYGVAC